MHDCGGTHPHPSDHLIHESYMIRFDRSTFNQGGVRYEQVRQTPGAESLLPLLAR